MMQLWKKANAHIAYALEWNRRRHIVGEHRRPKERMQVLNAAVDYGLQWRMAPVWMLAACLLFALVYGG